MIYAIVSLPKAAYLFQLYHTGMAGVRQRLNYPTQDQDVVIDRGQVRKRKKKPSKKFRHTHAASPILK
jgi:hypothetical protein